MKKLFVFLTCIMIYTVSFGQYEYINIPTDQVDECSIYSRMNYPIEISRLNKTEDINLFDLKAKYGKVTKYLNQFSYYIDTNYCEEVFYLYKTINDSSVLIDSLECCVKTLKYLPVKVNGEIKRNLISLSSLKGVLFLTSSESIIGVVEIYSYSIIHYRGDKIINTYNNKTAYMNDTILKEITNNMIMGDRLIFFNIKTDGLNLYGNPFEVKLIP